MIKSKLRKIAIVLSSLTVLSGSLSVDAAYARDGGFPYERFGSSTIGAFSPTYNGGEMGGTHCEFGRP
jgi:hypothetical protein